MVVLAANDTGPVAALVVWESVEESVTVASVRAGVVVESPDIAEATPDSAFPTESRRLPTPESAELVLLVSVEVVFKPRTCLLTTRGK